MATQRVWMWGGASRCDSSLAPGSASDWPTAGTDSRCEGHRAPGRVGWPLRGPARGVGLRGATFLTHLEAQVTGRQRERTPGAKRNRAPGRVGWPLRRSGCGAGLRGATFLSHLEAQVTERQWERTPGAKGIAHQGEWDGHSEGQHAGRGFEVRLFSRTWKRK